MKLRRLRDLGEQRMTEFLDSLKSDAPTSFPSEVLSDPAYCEAVSEAKVESREFENKYDLASYLHDLFKRADLVDVVSDRGLWSWLSLYYFSLLCPRDRGGRFKPGARARWIPEVNNYQRYYRHLLAGPYRIFYFHRDQPERTRALLCGPISAQGELIEQLASRHELITNRHLIDAVTTLYYDPKNRKNKRGAGGKGAGSPRRLAHVIDQFNLTWDLYETTPREFLALLPSEFDRFTHN